MSSTALQSRRESRRTQHGSPVQSPGPADGTPPFNPNALWQVTGTTQLQQALVGSGSYPSTEALQTALQMAWGMPAANAFARKEEWGELFYVSASHSGMAARMRAAEAGWQRGGNGQLDFQTAATNTIVGMIGRQDPGFPALYEQMRYATAVQAGAFPNSHAAHQRLMRNALFTMATDVPMPYGFQDITKANVVLRVPTEQESSLTNGQMGPTLSVVPHYRAL